jgi:hypothetical protein
MHAPMNTHTYTRTCISACNMPTPLLPQCNSLMLPFWSRAIIVMVCALHYVNLVYLLCSRGNLLAACDMLDLVKSIVDDPRKEVRLL